MAEENFISHTIDYKFDKSPRYIIYGGLVFAPITKNYLYSLTKLESDSIKKKLYSNEHFPTKIPLNLMVKLKIH